MSIRTFPSDTQSKSPNIEKSLPHSGPKHWFSFFVTRWIRKQAWRRDSLFDFGCRSVQRRCGRIMADTCSWDWLLRPQRRCCSFWVFINHERMKSRWSRSLPILPPFQWLSDLNCKRSQTSKSRYSLLDFINIEWSIIFNLSDKFKISSKSALILHFQSTFLTIKICQTVISKIE